jgi:hypothetical protein
MKYKFILPLFLLTVTCCYSQKAGLTEAHEFDQFQHAGGGGVSAFKTGVHTEADGSQFFLPEWSKGDVTLNSNIIFNSGMMFIYDKVRQEIFIRPEDSSSVLLGNKDDIKTFTLKDAGREYTFVNSIFYTNTKPEVFYQVLVIDPSKLTLLKYTKSTFVRADNSDMMKQREGKVNDAFIDNVTYYISNGKGTLQPIQFKTKSVKKAFAELKVNVDKYLNDHTEPINEDYMIAMVGALNQ